MDIREPSAMIHQLEPYATRIERENRVIEEAMRILDERLFSGSEHLARLSDVPPYLRLKLGNLPHEVFAIVLLNTKHGVLGYEELFRGTINSTSVHVREVIKCVLSYNAAVVIAVHNHPSGDKEPSAADRTLTGHLKEALALIDVKLLDHFIVGKGEPLSFAENNWI